MSPETEEDEAPPMCAACDEIHADGCPLDSFCEGCGLVSCRCDDGLEMDEV